METRSLLERHRVNPKSAMGSLAPHISFRNETNRHSLTRAVSGKPSSTSLPLQLAELQRRSRDVLGHAILQLPEATPLKRLAFASLEWIKRVHVEWQARHSIDPEENHAAARMAVMLANAHASLDRVVAQFALVDSTSRLIGGLLEISDRLLRQGSCHYYRLQSCAERLIGEITPVTSIGQIVPLPEIFWLGLIARCTEIPAAGIFINGITAARLMAWGLAGDRSWEGRISTMVIGTLFADVGLFHLQPQLERGVLGGDERADRLADQHPALSAALLGMVSRMPSDLPRIVAQHHERLDGSGTPRNLTAKEIGPAGRLIGITHRLAELYHASEPAEKPGIAGRLEFAVGQLEIETRREEWDARLSGKFSERITQALPLLAEDASSSATDRYDGDCATRPAGDSPSLGDRTISLHAEQELAGHHANLSETRQPLHEESLRRFACQAQGSADR